MEKSGFKVIAAIAAIAEHSIMHQYAAGRPDAKDRSELSSFAKKVLEKIDIANKKIYLNFEVLEQIAVYED